MAAQEHREHAEAAGRRRLARSGPSIGWSPVCTALAVLAALSLHLVPASASGEASPMELKAAFTYRFATLSTWPAEALDGDHFRIGVIGDSELADALTAAVEGREIHGLPIEVELLDGAAEAGRAHLVYLPNTAAGQLPEVLRQVRERAVLTVSDSPSFVESGGMIQIHKEKSRLAFAVNRGAALDSHIKISSKLLRLATNIIE